MMDQYSSLSFMHLSCKTGQPEMHSRPSETGRPVFGRNRSLRQSLICNSSRAMRFANPLDRDSKFWRLSMQRLVKVEGSIIPTSSGKETISAAGHVPTILISLRQWSLSKPHFDIGWFSFLQLLNSSEVMLGGKPPSGMDVRATQSDKLNS